MEQRKSIEAQVDPSFFMTVHYFVDGSHEEVCIVVTEGVALMVGHNDPKGVRQTDAKQRHVETVISVFWTVNMRARCRVPNILMCDFTR